MHSYLKLYSVDPWLWTFYNQLSAGPIPVNLSFTSERKKRLDNIFKISIPLWLMNYLLSRLTGGDLRSDGKADEVAETILKDTTLLPLLLEGLHEPDHIVRARTAHALEKISRTCPGMVTEVIGQVIESALHDDIPMVRWHMAMIFGYLSYSNDECDTIFSVLYTLLQDESVLVRSWAIVSLCILGTSFEREKGCIVEKIMVLQDDESKAIQSKVQKALTILHNREKIPPGWIKKK